VIQSRAIVIQIVVLVEANANSTRIVATAVVEVFAIHAAANRNELRGVKGKDRDRFHLPTFNPGGVGLLVSTSSTDATDDFGSWFPLRSTDGAAENANGCQLLGAASPRESQRG